MIKKLQQFQDLPIEEGKTYTTRFATGDKFLVKKVIMLKDKPVRFEGIYLGSEHIGICPLAIDRLIPEKIQIDDIYVCDSCSKPVDLDEIETEIRLIRDEQLIK
jgi:hypothetical protein